MAFAELPPGKYDPTYAARYAALWAYGSETLHSGWDESLYRSVSSLVAESIAVQPSEARPQVIVDAGCGVGRSVRDCAVLAPHGQVLGFDASNAMLRIARQVVSGSEDMRVALPQFGFEPLTIAARGLSNASFFKGDVRSLPLKDAVADIVLSVNVIDRLAEGPGSVIRECWRILRQGAVLVLTDPLNWADDQLWTAYASRDEVLLEVENAGFTIDTWFDELTYREILDKRGSYAEWKTLVIRATKVGTLRSQ